MKININKLFVIYTPTRYSEKLDVYDGRPTTLKGLSNQFKGGLTINGIHAIYTTKLEADKAAKQLFKKHKIRY